MLNPFTPSDSWQTEITQKL